MLYMHIQASHWGPEVFSTISLQGSGNAYDCPQMVRSGRGAWGPRKVLEDVNCNVRTGVEAH